MKEAANTNLDASHPVQEESAACTSKEFRLKKPPVKPKNNAKSTTRIEVASSTKYEDSLSDHKETTASINAEGNLKKAPEKPKPNGKSRVHMKEAANTNLDDLHSVQEETATCTSKECRLMKPPVKVKTKAKSTTRTLKKPPVKPKNKAKSTTRIEPPKSLPYGFSMSSHGTVLPDAQQQKPQTSKIASLDFAKSTKRTHPSLFPWTVNKSGLVS
ncbi:unnamed protein product [Pleuronectes platessa]|uniref:Uncharacterized protein n=1 Tax=Pleuronectes platessa TaxID=8262 RepID=A0A9N7Y643_PLEPL|nr:unnamed protein product [Pleuronectes platessa]